MGMGTPRSKINICSNEGPFKPSGFHLKRIVLDHFFIYIIYDVHPRFCIDEKRIIASIKRHLMRYVGDMIGSFEVIYGIMSDYI